MGSHGKRYVAVMSCLVASTGARPTILPSRSSLVLNIRGGGERGGGSSSIYELNPEYASVRSGERVITLGDLEHDNREIWIAQQYETQSFSIHQREPSMKDRIQTYVAQVHRHSPTLSMGSIACIFIFGLWQMPVFHGILQRYFVCSPYNMRDGRYVAMLLSAVSHASLTHLLVNLFAYLSLGPTLRQTLAMSNWPLWPVVLGAAMTGSSLFLLRGSQGGCMGLSGVTLAFMAVLAKIYPEREMGMALMGIIPVRMPAHTVLTCLLLWSALGSLSNKGGRVAHVTHLGGLLFGLGYYELWLRRSHIRSLANKFKSIRKTNFGRVQKRG